MGPVFPTSTYIMGGMTSSPHFPHSFTSPARKILVIAFALFLCVVLAACNPFAPKDDSSGNGGKSSQKPPTPEVVESDGFWRPNTFPDPVAETVVTRPGEDGEALAKLQVLSVDTDGTSARMFATWLPPVDRPYLDPRELQNALGSPGAIPWTRLVDFETGELLEPYETKTGTGVEHPTGHPQVEAGEVKTDSSRETYCVCSDGPPSDVDTSNAPENVRVFYADFPAPESTSVGMSFGDNAAFFEDIPVTQGEKFSIPELAELKLKSTFQEKLHDIYGQGAIKERRIPLDINTESVTEASVSDRGETSALNVSSDVLFEFDSDKLNKDAEKAIDSVVEELKKSAKGQKVVVEGHTDDEGDEGYNQGLSERRAESVKKAVEPKLSGAGIQLETKGFGETKPLVPNRDGSGNSIKKNQAKNRRVSFNYKPQAQIDANVDTGKKVKDLPEMKAGHVTTGLAAGILPARKGGKAPDLNFEILSLDEYKEFLKLKVAVSTTTGDTVESAFAEVIARPETMQFGPNAATGVAHIPTLANVQIWDKKTNLMATTVTAGEPHCICSQALSTKGSVDAPGEPIEMYAYLPKKGIESDSLTLRVADTAQITFERNTAAPRSTPGESNPPTVKPS